MKRLIQFIFRKGRYAHRPYCTYRYGGNSCQCESIEVEW